MATTTTTKTSKTSTRAAPLPLGLSSSDSCASMDAPKSSPNPASDGNPASSSSAGRSATMIGNANSRSVSMASVSSSGAEGERGGDNGNSAAVDPAEVRALTADVKVFNTAMSRLRRVNQQDAESTGESLKYSCHERLSELLNILRNMLEKYPALQSPAVVNSASYVVVQLKDFAEQDEITDEKEFHDALDSLALTFSNRVSEYLTGDIDPKDPSKGDMSGRAVDEASLEASLSAAAAVAAAGSRSKPEGGDPAAAAPPPPPPPAAAARPEGLLTVEEIDCYWMANAKGVDHALHYAKMWSKYAKEVITYVDKRASLELEMARGLSKLAQSTRPALSEEKYMPLRSVFCAAVDNDLETCSNALRTCSELQGNKFVEPLQQRLSEQNKARDALKKRWRKELRRVSEAVSNLNKAKNMYHDKNKEYERCAEAVRIAEQAAELGAAGEGKVDKRKRLEEEALAKTMDYKAVYMQYVEEANSRHKRVYELKAEVLMKIREMILQCDRVMKAVTVAYCQMQHRLASPAPIHFEALCEKSQLYEPGSQFMEYAKTMHQQADLAVMLASTAAGGGGVGGGGGSVGGGGGLQEGLDPFKVENPSSMVLGGPADGSSSKGDDLLQFFARQAVIGGGGGPHRKSLDMGGMMGIGDEGTYKFRGDKDKAGHVMAWAPNMGPIEPSDTDSIEGSSVEASPPTSPVLGRSSSGGGPAAGGDDVDGDVGVASAGVAMSAPSSSAAPTSSSVPSEGIRKEKESLAAQSHKFRKLMTPTKCRECDSYVFVGGFECRDCGLSAHPKCLEVLALQCGHKRLPRKMATFGVDLGQHLLESGTQIPPIVSKCVTEIEKRCLHVKGIYRVPGVEHKVAKICAAFESAPDLVELTDVQHHTLANVLKRYLGQLPEPLVTVVLYQDFLKVAKRHPNTSATQPSEVGEAAAASGEGPDEGGGGGGEAGSSSEIEDAFEAAIVGELCELTRRLPRHHLRTLAFLVHHLLKVSKGSDSNGMNAYNLARVFCPSLMRNTADQGAVENFTSRDRADIDHQTRVVELLILHATAIFGPAESVLPKDYSLRYTSMSSRSQSIAAVNMSEQQHHHHHDRHHKSSRIKGHKESSASMIGITHDFGSSTGSGDDFPPLPGQTAYTAADFGCEDFDEGDGGEDDDDAEAIPSCWLPYESGAGPGGGGGSKKSPLLLRGTSTPPKIIKASLKSFSGLEGVTSERLSTQDSTESGQSLQLGGGGGGGGGQKMPKQDAPASSSSSNRKSAQSSSSQDGPSNTTSKAGKAAKMSKVAKKHSLDDDYLSPGAATGHHLPLAERLSDLPGYSSPPTIPQSSLLHPSDPDSESASGKKISTSSSEGATTTTSSSLSADEMANVNSSSSSHSQVISTSATTTVSEQRRKFLSSVAAAEAGSGSGFRATSATIQNLEDHKVKIQVHGGHMSNAAATTTVTTRHHVVKQSSLDKGDSRPPS